MAEKQQVEKPISADQIYFEPPAVGTCPACGHRRFGTAGGRKILELADDTLLVCEKCGGECTSGEAMTAGRHAAGLDR